MQKRKVSSLNSIRSLIQGKFDHLPDGTIYKIDDRELVRTKIELHGGDKILFAPFEDPDGDDFARIIRIIELKI